MTMLITCKCPSGQDSPSARYHWGLFSTHGSSSPAVISHWVAEIWDTWHGDERSSASFWSLFKHLCAFRSCTRVKLALICSWDSDWRMFRHSWAEVASDSSSWHPGSLRVRLMLVRTRLRLKLSFPVPSLRTSRPTLAFSSASLVSLMAEFKRAQMKWKPGCDWWVHQNKDCHWITFPSKKQVKSHCSHCKEFVFQRAHVYNWKTCKEKLFPSAAKWLTQT